MIGPPRCGSVCLVYRRSVRASHVRSKPTHEKQYEEDDQDEADNTHAAVTEAIAVPAVNVVVVYKIDRLTRSLFDFAKIVEAFEAATLISL